MILSKKLAIMFVVLVALLLLNFTIFYFKYSPQELTSLFTTTPKVFLPKSVFDSYSIGHESPDCYQLSCHPDPNTVVCGKSTDEMFGYCAASFVVPNDSCNFYRCRVVNGICTTFISKGVWNNCVAEAKKLYGNDSPLLYGK